MKQSWPDPPKVRIAPIDIRPMGQRPMYPPEAVALGRISLDLGQLCAGGTRLDGRVGQPDHILWVRDHRHVAARDFDGRRPPSAWRTAARPRAGWPDR